MPYKLVTTKMNGSTDLMYDVIDPKLSRSQKVLKLFPYEEAAEQYAKKNLKKKDDEFKVIEVESAYDYEEDGFDRGPNPLNES